MILNFEDTIKDVTSYFDSKAKEGLHEDTCFNHSELRVKWHVEMDIKSWGIRDIDVFIDSFSFSSEQDDDEEFDIPYLEFEFTEKFFKEITYDPSVLYGKGVYCIQSAEINFENKSIEFS